MKTTFYDDIQVKPFSENDRYSVAALIREVLAEHDLLINQGDLSAEMARLARRYSASDAVFWVLFHESEVSGTIALRPQGEFTAEIENLYLKRKIRGRGIGAKLLQFVEEHAYKIGYRRIFVTCPKNMTHGMMFLENHEYRLVGNTDPDADTELYEKELF